MIKNHKFRNIDIYKACFRLSIGALVFSVFAQMIITNKLAVKGTELSKLNEQKQTLEKEIAKLEYEDTTLSSLSYIETKAKDLGFIKLTDNVLAVRDLPTAAVIPSH